MSDPYLGEIRMFAGNYPPVGWALCNGQLLDISENDALYSLIGTTYGGDGVNNFAVPDMQGRVPIHTSATYSLGAMGGTETVTLVTNQLPLHNHLAYASTATAAQASPSGAVWATPSSDFLSTGSGLTPVPMVPTALSPVGGSQPHDNMMPTLAISFIISLQGIYPSQN